MIVSRILLIFSLVLAAQITCGQNIAPKDSLPFFMDLTSINGTGWSSSCQCYTKEGSYQNPSAKSDTCSVILVYWADTIYEYQTSDGIQKVGSRIAMDTLLLSTYVKNNDTWTQTDFDRTGRVMRKRNLRISTNGRIVTTGFDAYGTPINTYYYFLIE